MIVNSKKFWTLGGLGLALVTVIAMVGCLGGFAPMAPNTTDSVIEQMTPILEPPNWLKYTLPQQPGAAKIVSAAKVVNLSSGGPVSVSSGSMTTTLQIPAQSTTGSVTISVALDTPGNVVVNFDPEGIQFNPPATLTVAGVTDSDGGPVTNPTLCWFNPTDDQWYEINTTVTVVSTNSVAVPLKHFSRYGLRDNREK